MAVFRDFCYSSGGIKTMPILCILSFGLAKRGLNCGVDGHSDSFTLCAASPWCGIKTKMRYVCAE